MIDYIKQKRLLLVLCLMISIVFNCCFFCVNTFADVNSTDIIKKWTITQYLSCASSSNTINSEIGQPSDSTTFVKNYVMQPNKGSKALPSFNFGGINIPSKKVDNTTILNCTEMFAGMSGFSGALSYAPDNVANAQWGSSERTELLLGGIGYKRSGGSNRIEILLNATNKGDGIKMATLKKTANGFEPIPDGANTGELYGYVKYENKNSDTYTLRIGPKNSNLGLQCTPYKANQNKARSIDVSKSAKADIVSNAITNSFKGLSWNWTCPNALTSDTNTNPNGYYDIAVSDIRSVVGSVGAKYKYNPLGMASQGGYANAKKSVKALFGESGVESVLFTNPEKITVFQHYVKMAVAQNGGKVDCESESNPDGSSYIETHLKDGDKFKTCYVNFGGVSADQISVYIPTEGTNHDNNKKYPKIDSGSMKTVLDKLKNDFEENDFADVSDWNASASGSSSGNVDGVKPTCANSGAAESLGWIVCPILEWMSNAATEVYDSVVEPSLKVDVDLFGDVGGESNVRDAWEVFRNIANGVFIVLLLVVIFSQLTGVGIDNYGIKKILPKLILGALLINVSYLLCLICVDLSNIVGNGMQGLFDGISPNMGDSGSLTITTSDGKSDTASFDTGAAITAVTLLAGVFGIIGVIANPAILLTLLVSALGILISILFLFVLLSGRQAVVIVLTVISPVALILFMLPNTKTYFDKWLKLWGAMLLLYPICGLLVGGGNFVSKLMLSIGGGSAGPFEAFTAMIIGVIPIFFIPSVLKGSFSALGTIGSKIAGVGDTLSRKTTKKARESEGYRAAQQRGYARKTRIKAGYNKDYKPTAIGNVKSKFANTGFGKAIGYGSLQRARVASAIKSRDSEIEADTALRNVQMEYSNLRHPNESTEAYLTNQLREVVARGDENGIFAVIDQMRGSNMQASHIAQATRNILGAQVMDKNFLERFAKKYSGDFLRKDYEQADWARKGGISSNGERSALGTVGADGNIAGGQWAAGNMSLDDMKDEDVAALSSDRLHDLMQAGMVTQSQAQRVWASNSNMDDTNRLMLGAYGNEGIQLSKQDAQFELNRNAIGPHRLSEEQVEAFTRRAAEATVIEDVDIRNRHDGTNQQSDTLYVHDAGPGNNPEPKPPSKPPSKPTPPGTSQSTGNPIGFA